MENKIQKVQKRDGTIVDFDQTRIQEAIFKALTATGQGDGKRAKKLSDRVVEILNRRFKKEEIPHVEQIQDIVEEVLILEGLVKTAKAYILYREQRRRIREAVMVSEEAVERIDQYLGRLDWEVQENANMAFSLQGLNHYGVSYIVKKYWLNKIYPKEIREAEESGDLHLHNLDTLGCYCMGWDLYDLLLKGFGGVPTKVESRPPKHFRAVLGQAVNFLYTLQGECYSQDTQVLTENGWKYFYEIKKDEKVFTLNPQTSKIELQKPYRFYEFDNRKELYHFKSKKLDLLVTPGHRMLVDQYCPNCKEKYHRKFVEAKEFKPSEHFIPKKSIWEGKEEKWFILPGIKIFQYRNLTRINTSLSPFLDNASKESQVVRINEEEFGEVLNLPMTKVITSQPLWKYEIREIKSKKILMDDWLKFFGFWLAEGCTSLRKRVRRGRKKPYYEYQVRISQNKGKVLKEFEKLLKKLPFHYRKKTSKNNKKKVEIEITNKQLFLYLKQFGDRETKFIPKEIKNLSKRQLKILFDWMMKGDGYIGNGNIEYSTKSKKLADDLQEIVLKLGWSANIYHRKKRKFKWYDVGVSRTKYFRLRNKERNIKKIKYQGKVYCLEVPNHTLYVRRNGKAVWCGNCAGAVAFSNFDTLLAPFIRYDNLNYRQVKQALQEFMYNMAVPTRVGFQCPFTNVTLDLKPSPVFAKQPVIIGGKPQKETYQEFEEEVRIFDRAFYEVMLEGDRSGKPFHFPIPTINITKDFPWSDPVYDPIFEASGKYGTNYFANYINSEMKPDDVRSMCFPATTKIIYKEGKHSRYRRTTIRNLVNNWNPKKEFYLLMNGKWVKITDAFKLKNTSGKIIKVSLRNGEVIKMTPDHPAIIIEDGQLKQVSAKDLKIGDLIPIAKKDYEGNLGDFQLGRWLGLYISEGGITKENTVYFSFNEEEKEFQNFVKEVAQKRFAFPVHITKDPRWKTCQIWVKSRAAVEWVRKFCSGDKAPKKRIRSSLYGMSKDFRLGVLVGIFQGDGYERDIEFNTTNRKLRDDVADLARSVGINYTKRTNPNNTKGEEQFTSYVLRLCRDSLENLLPYFKNIKASFSSIYKDFGEFYGVKIKSIEVQTYRAPVYDFEVESKEHLFQLANGVITHNCCRLRLNLTDLYNRGGGGLFGAGSLTGSIGVVTINLPRIGYLSKTKKEFFERLAKVMDLAKESLEIKRKTLENYIEKGLYPYSRFYLEGVKKMRGGYYANHFSTIGLVGMNEALLNFIGENIATKRGRRFALEVLDFMRKRLVKYQKETKNIYNLEATPAESTAYRLALKDKEKYPNIITAGTKKVPYYTNSSQLPVNYTTDPFEALKLQDEIQCKYTGGTVLHLFLGEQITDVETVKKLVKKVFENFHLPYITLTPTFSICPVHGYLPGEHFYCPKCTVKQPCEVYSRIVGYLRPVSQWNEGKTQEFKERKEFKVPAKFK